MKILIVDNRDIHREALTFTLRKLGHQIKTVSLGQSALRLLRAEKFDIALLGLFLMDMSGLKILEEIRLMDVVPIVMTDYESTVSAKEAILKGATDYMIKPFNPQTMQILLEKAVEHFRVKRHQESTEPLPRLEGISESILDNFPSSIFALNRDFILLKYNKTAGETYRLSVKMLGHHFLTLFPEAAQTQFPICFKKVLKTCEPTVEKVRGFSLDQRYSGDFLHQFYPLMGDNRLEGIILHIMEDNRQELPREKGEADLIMKTLIKK